jgi:hypothetical protein
MKAIVQNWNLMRFIRLLLGAMVIIQSINTKDYLFAFIALLFAGMALLNIRCCGTSGCSTNVYSNKKNTNSIKETTYEEVI